MNTCLGTMLDGRQCKNKIETKTYYCTDHSVGITYCSLCSNVIDVSLLTCYKHFVTWKELLDWCVAFFNNNSSYIPDKTNIILLENIRKDKTSCLLRYLTSTPDSDSDIDTKSIDSTDNNDCMMTMKYITFTEIIKFFVTDREANTNYAGSELQCLEC